MKIRELSVNPGKRIDIMTRSWDGRSGVRNSTGARHFSALHRDLTSSEFHPTAY
jgi:hypothetical protein